MSAGILRPANGLGDERGIQHLDCAADRRKIALKIDVARNADASDRGYGAWDKRSAIAGDQRLTMTSKADFTAEEWQLILEAPQSAGMIVITAQHGGLIRETIAMANAYLEARQEHGKSELLDEIVTAKPERDHTHYHSLEEATQRGVQHLRDSIVVLTRKATPEEVDEYRRFVLTLSHKVAAAHREHDQEVSESEQAAINDITEAMNTTPG